MNLLPYNCDCGGFVVHTLGGLRRHAQKCEHASAKLRATEDRVRLESIARAKKINRAAREDA